MLETRLVSQASLPCKPPYPTCNCEAAARRDSTFSAADLPADQATRDRVLIAAMCGLGGDDRRQIDGLGGADPLTSKVAIVGRSTRDDADLDYEFVQVVVGGNATDRTQNCGNILAGVVPFAIESGLLRAGDPETRARVYLVNSESICEVVAQTPEGKVEYAGDTRIDGAPGTAAPVVCNYFDTAGSACGSLLPTGHLIDTIDGVRVTCIDNGMPVVLLRAADLELAGYETPDELNADADLKAKLERIRLQAGPLMNLGDVTKKVVPKMSLDRAASRGRHRLHTNFHSACLSRGDRRARRGVGGHRVCHSRHGHGRHRSLAGRRECLLGRASQRRILGDTWRSTVAARSRSFAARDCSAPLACSAEAKCSSRPASGTSRKSKRRDRLR